MAKNQVIENHPDSFEEFKKWMDENFIKRTGGYTPPFMTTWWNKVEDVHAGLREKIGGTRIERCIKLKSQQSPTPLEIAKPIIDEIKKLLPSYTAAYKFDDSAFLMPTIPSGTHSSIRISKHIRQYADQYIVEDRENNLKKIDKLLASLGELWARSKTSNVNLEITLSTSPRSFTLLGHYGPDQDSCFRQGSDKTHHKYLFAQTKDTFVITISKFNEKKGKFVNAARCMGFTNSDYTVFNLANYYFSPNFQEGDALEAIKLLLEDVWQDEATLVEGLVSVQRDAHDHAIVYHNPHGNWSFVKGKNATAIDKHILYPDQNNILIFHCLNCGHEMNSHHGWAEIDYKLSCSSCVKKANKCDISERLTFKELLPLICENGGMKFIHPDIANTYEKCAECETFSEKVIKLEKGENVCSDCLEANYTECEQCSRIVSDEDLFEPSDRNICTHCVENGASPFDDETIEFVRGNI